MTLRKFTVWLEKIRRFESGGSESLPLRQILTAKDLGRRKKKATSEIADFPDFPSIQLEEGNHVETEGFV